MVRVPMVDTAAAAAALNIGVSKETTVEIKRLDNDYFDEPDLDRTYISLLGFDRSPASPCAR